MYQSINEPVTVVGVYHRGQFTPRKFRWQRRQYVIDEVTLSSDTKDGGVRKRLYSVTAGPNVYRLEFNRETEQWQLAELWVE
ncbi:MAG: hypothetical protein COU69_00260 [Candidatus Pacebacteria bacterium CG10_big_fil_rev_8_21_14_0_10_56_10]|nr:MAG: hypothetical protein COU69_00260 [Candidatus Pacebacteria bacterium CG10_big_fil_rev_8_21_14_0_10_56_10]